MLDVAIVGGGAAGAYCAYRLTSDTTAAKWRIGLFEASDRIGGRLWSVPLSTGADKAEIGGMYFRSRQTNVCGLIEHLGLATEPVSFAREGHFVRGQWCDDAGLVSTHSPFNLAADERQTGPAAVLIKALESVAPGSTDLWPVNRLAPRSARATFKWLREQRHFGKPLEALGLWQVLSSAVSAEFYALLISTLGSTSLFRNINAFDGVWNLLHELGDGDGMRIREGYQALPLALSGRAEAQGAVVRMRHRLRAVTCSDGCFRLHFLTPEGDAAIAARTVILALPQRALQHVDIQGQTQADGGEYERIRDNAVSPVRSCKIFLTYDKAWWRAEPGSSNHAQVAARYSDLPLQQCYGFGREAGAPALLLAAYADDAAATFWKAFSPSDDAYATLDGAADSAPTASEALVQAVRRQLDKVFGSVSPAPSGALYFDWGADPYGGAWHAWAPHFKSWEIRPRMRRPNPRLDLFICGEAYSQRSGWVEGAINSAERTLELLGLDRPGWIADPHFEFEIDDGGMEDDQCNHADVQRLVAGYVATA